MLIRGAGFTVRIDRMTHKKTFVLPLAVHVGGVGLSLLQPMSWLKSVQAAHCQCRDKLAAV